MHFAISCGGTGGHTLPGLATAHELLARGHRVTLVLTTRSTDATTAAAWSGPVLRLPADYLTPRHPVRSLRAWFTLRASRAAAIAAFRADRPDAVLAMGSYTSYPAASAALALHIPLAFHESNVIPGRAVAMFARRCAAIAAGLPGLAEGLPANSAPVTLTGTPIRPELLAAADRRLAAEAAQPARPGAPAVPHLLITGGSQGAKTLNTAAVGALARLAAEHVPFRATHLTGKTDHARVLGLYQAAAAELRLAAPPPVTVIDYTSGMANLYANADFAMTRSGASTLAELAAFHLPALLVPYPLAAKDHQTANAKTMVAIGAADLVPDAALAPDALHDYLAQLLHAPAKLAAMREAYRHSSLPSPAAAPRLLASLLESLPRP